MPYFMNNNQKNTYTTTYPLTHLLEYQSRLINNTAPSTALTKPLLNQMPI